MKRIGSIVLVLVVAGTVLAAADATTGAAKKAYCKRVSASKPYVARRGPASAFKPADIFPVPSGGCPKTVLSATAGGTAMSVTLAGESESPAGDPVGTGQATFHIRAGQGQVCYTLATTNLPTAVGAHIHNGAAGSAGPIVVPLKTPGSDGKSTGCATASRAVVKSILGNAASYYVNVHTDEFAAGAIRGQLAGSSATTLGTSFAINLAGSSEPNAKGTAVVRVRKDDGLVCYRLHAESVTLPTVAAHIHRGGPTANGPVVVPFQAPGASGNSDGCATAQAAIIDEILATPSNFYVNVHTTEHPAGAMRAQLG